MATYGHIDVAHIGDTVRSTDQTEIDAVTSGDAVLLSTWGTTKVVEVEAGE